MEWNTKTIEDFEQTTKEILKTVSEVYQQQGNSNTCVVCLHGDLGSGKTTMTQIIGKLLGVTEAINSPTFVIKKVYKTNNTAFETLIHMDAYRLEGEQNIDVFRLDEDFKNSHALMVIEWPEIISQSIPSDAIHIFIEHTPTGRKILLQKTA